jgi:hypothetical protein
MTAIDRRRASLAALALAVLPGAAAEPISDAVLDRISVKMPRSQAQALLGQPSLSTTSADGLEVALYALSERDPDDPLRAKGLVYEPSGRLAGHALVIDGLVAERFAELLAARGYRRLETAPGAPPRLEGEDDDTGHPQTVVLVEQPPHTIVVTLEQGFYTAARR